MSDKLKEAKEQFLRDVDEAEEYGRTHNYFGEERCLIERRPPHPLKAFFKDAGVRQVDLATVLGVSLVTVNQWLSGRRPPPADVEEKLEMLRGVVEKRFTLSLGALRDVLEGKVKRR
jgi:DNA-binding transcriptional regulator YiaG